MQKTKLRDFEKKTFAEITHQMAPLLVTPKMQQKSMKR